MKADATNTDITAGCQANDIVKECVGAPAVTADDTSTGTCGCIADASKPVLLIKSDDTEAVCLGE